MKLELKLTLPAEGMVRNSSSPETAAVARICHKLRSLGEREVASRSVGDMVMEELRRLDKVAYVRFASVYRSFQDIDDFRDAIRDL